MAARNPFTLPGGHLQPLPKVIATTTFSTLPPEIQIDIAEYCVNHDLFNLCLTSSWANEIFSPVLYRHVDFLTGYVLSVQSPRVKQLQFLHTLLSHPEHS